MNVRNANGFTIIEMLVSLALAGMATTAIYTTYTSQQRSYVDQQDVAAMQQNLRAAMHLLSTELRMAGYDPTDKADAGIVSMTTSPASIRFTADLDADGSISDTEGESEDITYALYTGSGVQKLGRQNPATSRAVAEHIDALRLAFLDEDNAVTAVPEEVRSIQITMVAKTAKASSSYHNPFTYSDLQGNSYTIAADGYRRAVLSFQVKCRNLGL